MSLFLCHFLFLVTVWTTETCHSLDDLLILLVKSFLIVVFFSVWNFFRSFINPANLLQSVGHRRGSRVLSVRGCCTVLVVTSSKETGVQLEGHCCCALVPKGHCLDAGKNFPLMPGQCYSHVQQILCGDLGQLIN